MMILCIWFLTTPLVPYDIVRRFPGRFCCRALCDTFRCYAVIMVHRAPRSRAGFHLCLALCCVWRYAVLWCVTGIRRFETFWCYAVLWRHRQAGDHIFLCPMHNLYFGNKHFDIFFICIIFYISDSIIVQIYFCTFCFAYSVHISYWPPSPGAAFHARRYGRTAWWSTCLGHPFCYSECSSLSGAYTFGIYIFISAFVYIRSWVRRGPVPSYDSVGLFRGLWTCLWVRVFLYGCMYMSFGRSHTPRRPVRICCLGDPIRRGGRSAYVYILLG